jgi:hypothetical protein
MCWNNISTYLKIFDVTFNIKRGIVQLHNPPFSSWCRIRIFEVFRNNPFALQILSNIRNDEFYGQVFIPVSMSSLRSVLLLFHGEKEDQKIMLEA